MKKLLVAVFCSALLIGSIADAGTTSSRGGGGFSSGGSRSVSSPSTSRGSFSSAPSRPSTPSSSSPSTANRGGFNSQSASKPTTRTTTTTTTTNTSRSYSGSSYRYNSPYVGGGMMYGGWGMGFGYTNGLLTGMIIANMMHPTGTVMYNGGGSYNNNALLYPDGSVVNQQGYQVGTYENGQFNAIQNGPKVAQPVPADAGAEQVQASPAPQQVAQPVIIQKRGPSAGEVVLYVFLGFGCVILFIILIGML